MLFWLERVSYSMRAGPLAEIGIAAAVSSSMLSVAYVDTLSVKSGGGFDLGVSKICKELPVLSYCLFLRT